MELELTRRDVLRLMVGAALLGIVGGLTAQEDGSWGESDEEEDEPPRR